MGIPPFGILSFLEIEEFFLFRLNKEVLYCIVRFLFLSSRSIFVIRKDYRIKYHIRQWLGNYYFQ